MNLDDMQESWRSQDAEGRTSIDVDQLCAQLQQRQLSFQTSILGRDFCEVGVAAVLVVFLATRAALDHDWTLWLLAGSMVWVGGFMLVDRWWQKRKAAHRPQPPTL